MIQRLPLVAFLIACSITAVAQVEQTHVKDGRVLYQNVFEGDVLNPLEFLEKLKYVDEVREMNGTFFGTVTIRESAVKQAMPALDMRWGSTGLFLQGATTQGQVQIEAREGRYRITITDFIVDFANPQLGDDREMEIYCVKKDGSIRAKNFDQVKKMYDYLFSDWFKFEQETEVESDDW